MLYQAVIREACSRSWLGFHAPRETFETDDIAQVLPTLQAVSELVDKEQLYAVGFISYEAAAACDAALTTQPRGCLPLLWFSLFFRAGSAAPAAGFGGNVHDR